MTPHVVTRRATRRALGAVVALASALVLAACASEEGSSSDDAPDTAAEGFKVAYLPCGKVNDQSWSQAGYEGVVEAAEELDLEVSVSESLATAEVEDAMRGYANDGYKVVLGHCGSFVDAATKVASEFPDVWFELAGAPEGTGANTFSYDPQQQEGSFLAGMLAGFMSKTDKLGMVVAFDFPAFNRQSEAFALGAAFVKPGIAAKTTFINSFEDAAVAKEAALSIYDGGADVIFVATDQAAVGVFEAAKERNLYSIAQYADQGHLAPKNILTSVLYKQGASLTEILKAIGAGTLEPAGSFSPGLSEGVGELAPFGELDSTIPQAAKDCLTSVAADIVSGALEVPDLNVIGTEGAAAKLDVQGLFGSNACYGAAE